MANIIEMPKLSDTMTVGTLVKWLKKEGDAVKSGDMLAEVETDKATMELESFFDGTLLKIFAPAGSQVAIGAPLCAIGKPGEKVDAPARQTRRAAPTRESSRTPAAADKDKAGAATTAKNEVQAEPAAAPQRRGSDSAAVRPVPGDPAPPPRRATGDRVKISPLARKLAAEKGIDPARITGSGPGGRIVRADVLAAEKTGTAKAGAASAIGAGPQPFAPSGPALSRRARSRRSAPSRSRTCAAPSPAGCVESKTQLPHFYVEIEIDAAPLLALREQLNTGLEKEGVKLSVNDFILKASAEALRRVPQVNGSWEARDQADPAISPPRTSRSPSRSRTA